MARTTTPIGTLYGSPLRDLANTIKLRTMSCSACPILVYVDDGDVFAVREDSTAARYAPTDAESLIGTYTRKSSIGAICDDLICARDQTPRRVA